MFKSTRKWKHIREYCTSELQLTDEILFSAVIGDRTAVTVFVERHLISLPRGLGKIKRNIYVVMHIIPI